MPIWLRRVVCGFGETAATGWPSSAFIRVDLPTLGLPTTETNPALNSAGILALYQTGAFASLDRSHRFMYNPDSLSTRFGGRVLANIKSAIKRNRQNAKLRKRNTIFRGSARTFVKKANLAIQSGDVEAARAAAQLAASALDKAAGKGVIHKNNAARRKGAMMSKLAALEKGKK